MSGQIAVNAPVLVCVAAAFYIVYRIGRLRALLDVNRRVFKPWIDRLATRESFETYARAWDSFTSIR